MPKNLLILILSVFFLFSCGNKNKQEIIPEIGPEMNVRHSELGRQVWKATLAWEAALAGYRTGRHTAAGSSPAARRQLAGSSAAARRQAGRGLGAPGRLLSWRKSSEAKLEPYSATLRFGNETTISKTT